MAGLIVLVYGFDGGAGKALARWYGSVQSVASPGLSSNSVPLLSSQQPTDGLLELAIPSTSTHSSTSSSSLPDHWARSTSTSRSAAPLPVGQLTVELGTTSGSAGGADADHPRNPG